MLPVYYTLRGKRFPEKKTCKKCGVEKSYLEFPEDLYYPCGRGLNCSECIEKRLKAYRLANRDKFKARYQANRGQSLEKYAAYNRVHREELKAKKRANHHARKEHYNQASREYRETHKDEIRERQRAWYKANAAKHAEYMRRRDAKKIAAAVGKVSYDHILECDGMWCYICEKPILPEHKIDFDHVIPLSRNGSHSEDNIKATHHICNRRKNNRLLEEMTPYQRRGVS